MNHARQSPRITIRVSAVEKHKIEMAAKRAGLPVGKYIRRVVLRFICLPELDVWLDND